MPESQSQSNTQASDNSNAKPKSPDQDWQFVIPVPTPGEKGADEKYDTDILDLEAKDGFITIHSDTEAITVNGSNEIAQASGIIPAARARLASLRDLGAKKIGALKLKLIENKIKSNERGKRPSPLSMNEKEKEISPQIDQTFLFCRSESPEHHATGNNAYA